MVRFSPTVVVFVAILLLAPPPAIAQEGGAFPATIQVGSCDDDGETIAELASATLPTGNRVGADEGQTAATSFMTVPVSLDALADAAHAVRVTSGGETAACGEIGGVLNDAGALVIVLQEENGSGTNGIAYMGVNAADPAQTDVSLFVAGIPETGAQAVAQENTTETPGPSPTPTFEEQVADYVPLADVRSLRFEPAITLATRLFSRARFSRLESPQKEAFTCWGIRTSSPTGFRCR